MRIRRHETARWRHLPAGFRDQAVAEVAARRRVEDRLREVFARWGYGEVITPTLEFLDTFARGAGTGIGDRLLKLVDSGGEVLALRPEMTVPLARFAATRLLPSGHGPLRLAYVAPVFRGQDSGSGRLREFTQAGIELIDQSGPEADAEVIALAAEALEVVGVRQPALHVGHAGFVHGLLATLPEDAAERARERLYRRAFADLEDGVPAGSARDALRLLPSLRGADVLNRAALLALPHESRGALTALRKVLVRLEVYRPAVHIEVDLGLIRDFDYYSGTVFEAHSGRAGLPLLGGGRYDGLLGRFGRPAPATGFAIGIERVLEAGVGDFERRPTVLVRYAAGQYETAVGAATSLRAVGLIVVIASDGAHAGVVDPACTVIAAGDALRVAFRGGERTVAAGALVDAVRSALGRA